MSVPTLVPLSQDGLTKHGALGRIPRSERAASADDRNGIRARGARDARFDVVDRFGRRWEGERVGIRFDSEVALVKLPRAGASAIAIAYRRR